MMWFELQAGQPAEQPHLLLLPEEWYCPAAQGSQQSIDYYMRLSKAQLPFWGIPGRTVHTGRFGEVVLPNDRYVTGGVKDCHAMHIHLSLQAFSFFNVSDVLRSKRRQRQAEFALFFMDHELFCSQRSFNGIQPRCHVGQRKLVFPDDVPGAGRRLAARKRRDGEAASDCGVYRKDAGCILKGRPNHHKLLAC